MAGRETANIEQTQVEVRQSRRARQATLTATIGAGALAAAGLYFLSRNHYLLFHGLVEAFGIVIAFAIFAIAWNSRRIVQNSYFLFIGIAFLALAPIGLIHTLAYNGMGVFPGTGSNLATQLWVGGRYLLSASLLASPLFLGRKLNVGMVIAGFAAADAIIFATIFLGVFPTAYVQGTGLTAFKIASEYGVSLVFLGAIGLLVSRRSYLSHDFVVLMVAAIATNIASDLAFTLYTDVYGIANMVGHLLMVASFYLVYKALVETSLVRPYDLLFRDLKQSETSLERQTAQLSRTNARLVSEMAEREKAQQEISRQEKRYRDTLDGMIEGCQMIGFDWRYIYVNEAAARQGRRSREELLGQTMMESYPGIDQTEMFSVLDLCMRERSSRRLENEFRYPDGTSSWFELNIQPVPEGIFILSMDISDRKQAEQMKDEFIGMVSHELKNPLTVIVGALATAADDRIPEDEARLLLGDAAAEANELGSMIDNLLELSRQQAKRLVLQTEPVDIAESSRSVVKKLEGKSEKHHLVLDVSDDLPPLQADKVRVERVLYNLVDNAIKYSPGGGEVKITAQRQSGNVLITVADHGIGMTVADQTRLFQSFERLKGPGEKNIQGIGLGLRVCRHLIEAHGGRIWVQSEPGRGSTFYFTLPVQA